MSFILDALRRADSERERGRVPGLHAQAHAMSADHAADDHGPAGGRFGAMQWLVGGAAALALVLLGAWASTWLSAPEPVHPPVVAVSPVQPAPLSAPPPRSTPGLVELQAPPLAAALPPVQPAASVLPKEQALPLLSQLPEELRRQVPALTSGGSMYSETPASRMLILNGQLLHEGDLVGGVLLLEEIKLNGAVLSIKGQKFRISF
ncbi:general secretion pathway protein GspB [Paucibacter sp. JuS9]|uniref:general secretion pathway protein GspB n=1 Tax=Paucibacter sp. JuS9 TaxID=3228748 RepID=UPI0037582633